ncbi:MAG: hypothetical protein UU08_C0028G0010 [Candidatus Uhrbacteria bacterium GW2011_GWE2_40_58]|nr:MAG: hypothetical protein UT94_C0038G0010 [Candidatus Uhrbacteria bacterium GW2011_GWF2_40_263]KKR67078.1 MAG: hypothetical protein UU08_C0028G0010 [Candidatus Uhrbacteria bacterium GW2011_GWE2_40_58]OGL93991.1 MAG: hypothetical protein A2239_04130 [Candidatus Uhrbacteria bacterium RIFOXYA2_FULL_40_9]OGL97823.1 MAG: hypothetical protein A2332_02515 [Candidatus Uhrbacteria bacterium RIFOXYB2_FULL_41_18]HBK35231.1 hypothetical protein [Candidatus Uhrbacteria bacterium]
MRVLITGIGNVGKSHFRRYLYQQLKIKLAQTDRQVKHYDVDRFAHLRHKDDEDLLIDFTFQSLERETIVLIEDVHGATGNGLLPLNDYDHVFYIQADPLTHVQFWLGRAQIWFKEGRYDWDNDRGRFYGTHRKNDLRNVPGIARCVFRQLWQRKEIEHDLVRLSRAHARLHLIQAKATKNGPVFSPIPPNFLDECLYG